MILDFLKKQASNFTKIEFWGFTTLYAFILFFFITDALNSESALKSATYLPEFEKAHVPFYYYKHYFVPQFINNISLFLAFLLLNFIIIPKLIKRESLLKNILFLVLVFVLSAVIFGITNTYLKGYMYTPGADRNEVDRKLVLDGFDQSISLFAVLLFYSVIKYSGLYLLSKIDAIHRRFPYITREAIICIIIWMVTQLLLFIGGAEWQVTLSWLVLIPYAIAFYSFAFHKIIPASLTKKRPLFSYLMRAALTIGALFFPLLLVLLLTAGEDPAFNISGFNTLFQLFVTVPLTWLLYKRQQRGNEEVAFLKKELKQSTANIDFLRSQINPHFLFNALNTLYGTAIQENAERTSEGIQKLGDMMRFMLQENMQEKISLSREIDYLTNYIELQRLRTDSNPIVQIQTDIHSNGAMHQIAPMLLIPFVENAFKHGISFREPSHIKVTLDVKDNTLFFDVFNSKHVRNGHDPEKDKSGIGLENVRQRLKLSYPNKHELQIRDTTKEFFVHLTIRLA